MRPQQDQSKIAAVLALLEERGPLRTDQVAGELGITPSQVWAVCSCAVRNGRIIVEPTEGSRYRTLYLSDGALQIIRADTLPSKGLVACKDAWGVTYRLTEAGRAACPTRRQPTARRSHAQAA